MISRAIQWFRRLRDDASRDFAEAEAIRDRMGAQQLAGLRLHRASRLRASFGIASTEGVRKGSQVGYLMTDGVPAGIVELHPDHPPRIHYYDRRGTVEYPGNRWPNWLDSQPQSTIDIPAAKQ